MRLPILTLLTASFLLTSTPIWAQAKETTAPPSQETAEKRLELRSDFWYHLAATPAYALWQNNLHEGTHAIVGSLQGLSVKSYRPYPHTFRDRNGDRYFTYGRVTFDGTASRKDVGWIAGSPMILEAAIFVSSDILLGQIDQDSTVAPFLWFGGMAWPLFQFVYSTLTPKETDLTMVTRSLNMNYDIGVAAVTAVSIAGLARTVTRGHQVLLTEKGGAETDTDLAVVPIFGRGFQGLSVQGSF